jgi:hypothetical protein
MNILFTFIFIRNFGMWGAVVSSVLTKIVICGCFYYYGQKTFKLNIDNSSFAIFFAFVFIVVFFWVLATADLLSFKVASLLQLACCSATAILLNGRLIKNSYGELRVYIKNRFATDQP